MEKAKVSNYQLVREHDDKVLFEGSYTKYFPSSPHCAIFEAYPATETRVQVCQRVANDDTSHGLLRCRLISRGYDSPETEIGKYIPLCEVRSEKEAIEAVESNIRGCEILLNILGG